MINSMSSPDRAARLDAVTPTPLHPQPRGPESDRFLPEHTEALRTGLARHPEIRPEVVERARALAADPSYPSPAILRRVGEIILGSPDPADQND